MGEGHRLDDLARDLASGAISRRTALRRLAAGAIGVGIAAAPSALADELERGSCPKKRRCGRKCCPKGAKCENGKCKCKPGRVKCKKACCKPGEVCEDGQCVPGAECSVPGDCPQPPNPCVVATCTSGTCGEEPAPGIDDGLTCTIDVCDSGSGTTSHILAAGNCLIAGQCYSSGAPCPGGTCEPNSNPTACTPANLCGNGAIDGSEECDGNNLDNTSCQDLGFDGGTLACDSNCQFDTSGCIQNECETALDCPGEDSFCKTRTCTSGTCGFAFTDVNTPTPDQTPGDCQKNVCNGTGGVVSIADDNDTPTDDGIACTTSTCQNGVVTNTPSDDLCDDGNQCTDDFCDPGQGCDAIVTSGAVCDQYGGSICNSTGLCVATCDAAEDCPSLASQCKVLAGCTGGLCEYGDAAGIGSACSVGVGACSRTGTIVCDGQGGMVCSATPGTPSAEVCDDIDNDCDGQIDENLGGEPCGNNGISACINGVLVCQDPRRRRRLRERMRWRR